LPPGRPDSPKLAKPDRRSRLADCHSRLRACRKCHAAGFLVEDESIPVAFDGEIDAPIPRILLIGQAPGLKGSTAARPWSGAAGDRLRAWFEEGGISQADFWRKIHFSAVTRCYPGRLPGSRGDRLPSPAERELCRPWLEEVIALIEPEIVLLLGLLAIRTVLGPVSSLASVVGTARVVGGVRYLPLPHPSGVSRWLNDPANLEAVARGMLHLKGWVDELGI
jgi:uracil-DNA glycosylase